MGMPDAARRWTAQMVRELPDDGNRYEVVHGVLLVTPAPGWRHQIVLGRLHARLRAYLEPLGLGDTVLFSPADISWDEQTLVQPDLFVYPAGEMSGDWATIKTLLLAVECLSPSSVRADRVIKRRLYQEKLVNVYWVLDIDAASVDVWRPQDARPETVTDVLRWQVAPDAPVFELDLRELFGNLPREVRGSRPRTHASLCRARALSAAIPLGPPVPVSSRPRLSPPRRAARSRAPRP
jgi:Uma2 family endonuclease